MALVVNDRVKETSTTTGTGTLTLDGAVTGFETFSSAIGNTNTTYYAIELPNTAEFEVGLGTVSAGQLARTTVISSSNSDALVNFSSGTKNVFCTLPASKAVIKDASDNVIFGDNEKANFGDSNDLQIYHTGGSSYISDDGTGHLNLRTNGSDIRMIKTDGTIMLQAVPDNRVDLYYNGSKKFETTSTGATVTGNLTATGNLTVTSDSSSNGIFLKGRSSDDIGTLKFLSNSGASSQLEISSRPTVGIFNHPTDTSFRINNTEVFGLDSSAVKVNETGADVDFIVESVNNANMLHVNAGNDKVGIGGVPSEKLSVIGSNNTSAATLKVKDTDGRGILISSPYSGSGVGFIGTDGTNSAFGFKVNGTEYARFGTNGYLGIGTSSPSTLLHLSSSDPQITITDTDGTGSQVIKAVTDDLTLDAVSSINLDADSGVITFKDGGTQFGSITKSGNDLRLVSSLSDGDLVFRGNDGGVGITALTLDMSEAGAATFNDKVILGANKVIEFGDAGENISGDGTDMTISSSSNINLDAAAGITLDAGTSGIKLDDDGTTIGLLYFLSGNLNIKPSQSDTDLVIKGNDGGSEITALTLDMSEAGDATFNSNIYLGDNKKANFGAGNDLQIYHDGSLSYIVDSGTGDLRIESNFLRLVDRDNNSTTATFDSSGVNLRHSDAVKLTTVSTGIDVTGTAVTDGLTVAGDVSVDSGTIKLDGNYPTGTDNVALGDTALDSVTSGGQNTAIGSIALTALTTASFNTAIGYKALEDNISGTKNTAIGSNAASNTTGANNVAIGVRTLFFNTLGGKNTAVGEEALLNGTSASQNTALGYQAGTTVSGGSNLTILGYQAEPSSGTATNEITLGNASVTSLRIPGLTSGASSGDVLTYNGTDIGFSTPSTGIAAVVDDTTPQLGGDLDLNSNNITGTGNINNVGTITTDGLTVDGNVSVDSGTIKLDGNYPTGTNNVAMGDTALDSVTTGSSNTMIGHQSGTDLLGGGNNTGIGNRALANITSANHNTAVGSDALLFATTGGGNTAIGRAAMQTERTGGSNVAVGQSALVTQNGGNNNTGIGYQAGNIITTGSNLTLLGYQAQPSSATATNEITLGNASVTSLRIPGLASGASSGDVLTYDGTDITLSAPTGVSAGFSIAMAIAL